MVILSLHFLRICRPLYIFLQAKLSSENRGVFYLDAPSASVCLLIQLEKTATEEGGVTTSVYSRKEPVISKILNFPLLSLESLAHVNALVVEIVVFNIYLE